MEYPATIQKVIIFRSYCRCFIYIYLYCVTLFRAIIDFGDMSNWYTIHFIPGRSLFYFSYALNLWFNKTLSLKCKRSFNRRWDKINGIFSYILKSKALTTCHIGSIRAFVLKMQRYQIYCLNHSIQKLK